MATQVPPGDLDLQEQFARIRQIIVNSEKLQLEHQKLQLEQLQVQTDTEKALAETRRIVADMLKAQAETKILPFSTIFQAMLATAALLGAGAAIAKLFFP
ncbi:MAG: hypothetical protein A4S12_01755 [Proteobacteria bacterium SG_bin5]|nr:hypothetical protein [Sphingomonas sp.]OQW40296.1 MAG: hypothetical protein A4S12_01755 [Proteobacteria bacterium SG_bin5]